METIVNHYSGIIPLSNFGYDPFTLRFYPKKTKKMKTVNLVVH